MENKAGNKTIDIGGIRLRRLNAIMFAVMIVLCVVLMLVAFDTQRSFKNLEESTDKFILARQNVANMQAGSDYLTDRVRTFIVTGERSYADDFFVEIGETRRRDKAIENMESLLPGFKTSEYLKEALRLSNELAEIELYAMRLAIEARDLNLASFPEKLRQIELTETDAMLSKDEQAEQAELKLFDSVYQNYKENIRSNVQKCEEMLTGETERLQLESEARMQLALTLQTVLMTLVLLLVLAIVASTQYLIIKPIGMIVDAIPNEGKAPEIGAFETRFLARAYNTSFEQTKEHQERLAYEASHDQLTGLYNRSVFEKMRESNGRRAHTLILVDVDHFKSINDTYGHAVGDAILKKVASILRSNFRSEDYVCRIGGDEFAVIMLHTNASMRKLIEGKIQSAVQKLADVSDGLPAVTLSVGVAFRDSDHMTEDLYKDADAALYDVKGKGKNGYSFYDDIVPLEKEKL